YCYSNKNTLSKSLIAADEHGLKGHRSLFGILYHIVAPQKFCTNYNLNIFLSDQRPAKDMFENLGKHMPYLCNPLPIFTEVRNNALLSNSVHNNNNNNNHNNLNFVKYTVLVWVQGLKRSPRVHTEI
uniref:Uncharacterized protein n=1 Tax=Glossina palpalis gambiensis TaxID=67801 RepID=A0A1B0BY46_9MUSC